MKSYCDLLINVPGSRTAFVQELHLPVYHTLCQMVEHSFFGNPG
jgi:D-sedoheptulose 7-phosphate isomerase